MTNVALLKNWKFVWRSAKVAALCGALALIVCESAVADQVTFKISGDASGTSAFTNADAWNPAVAPSSVDGAGYDYIVNNGGEIRMPDTDATFGGHSLTLGEVGGKSGRMAVQGWGKTTTISDLVLANGNFHNPRQTTATIAGKITIVSPPTAPFGVYCNTAGSVFSFAAALTTDSSATPETVQGNFYCLNADSSFVFSGSLADYRGAMNFYVTDAAAQTLPVRFNVAEMPGRIIAGAGVRLTFAASGTTTVGSIEFKSGSELVLNGAPGDNVLVVTSGIDFPESGPVSLSFGSNSLPIEIGDGRVYRLVSVHGRLDSFSASRFALPQAFRDAGIPPYELTVLDEGGAKTLVLRTFKTLQLDQSDALHHSGFLASDSANWLVAAGENQGSDVEPNPEWNYLVRNGGEMRTPDATPQGGYDVSGYDVSGYVFGGRSLILMNGMLAHKYVYAVEVPNIVLGPTGKIAASGGGRQPPYSNSTNQFAAGGTQRLNGRIHAVPSFDSVAAAEFRSQENRYLWIDSEIDGTLDIDLVNVKADNTAYFELSGLNTNYVGRFAMRCVNTGAASDSTVGVLRFADARNLGGSPASFVFDAVSLKDNSVLWDIGSGRSSVAENRGLYVCGENTLTVDDGATLELSASVTLDGVLVKNGGGRLVLGDAARFGATSDGDPAANANEIHVAEGVLGVAHAEALDGVAVSFAAGTSLEIAYSDSASDLAQRGVVLVRDGSGLSVGGEVLPVSVTGAPADAEKFKTAVATLGTQSDAVALAQRLCVTAQIGEKARKATLSIGGNDADGYTIRADFSPSGLIIFCR